MAFPSVVVTGTSGFVGPHLINRLLDAGLTLECWNQNLGAAVEGVRQFKVDIRNTKNVATLMKAAKPSYLIHLAAISHVPTSFTNPELCWSVNAIGTLHLLEAVKNHSPHTKVLYVSSSEVYGAASTFGGAHEETTCLAPGNPYAASKAAADLMAQQYARNGLDVMVARPFNHTGPGQLPSFVLPAFARQIALIERGEQEAILSVGNLEVERDFLDVRDVVAAYVTLILSADIESGSVFNICSGRARNLKKALLRLIELSGANVEIDVDPEKFRVNDAPVVYGDYSRLNSLTGWRPTIAWDQTLGDLLDYARKSIR